MKMKFLTLIALLMIGAMVSEVHAVTFDMEGTLGSHKVKSALTMKSMDQDGSKHNLKGTLTFLSKKAPLTGTVKLSGIVHRKPPKDEPWYPWFEGVLNITKADGKCGKCNIGLDSRSGFIEGTCTINGTSYKLLLEE